MSTRGPLLLTDYVKKNPNDKEASSYLDIMKSYASEVNRLAGKLIDQSIWTFGTMANPMAYSDYLESKKEIMSSGRKLSEKSVLSSPSFSSQKKSYKQKIYKKFRGVYK